MSFQCRVGNYLLFWIKSVHSFTPGTKMHPTFDVWMQMWKVSHIKFWMQQDVRRQQEINAAEASLC